MTDNDNQSTVTRDPQPTPGTPEAKSLEEQLADLKAKQAAAAVEQVDSTISELTKVISDVQKAEAEYVKVYDQLKDQENRLKAERDAVSAALQAALGTPGVEAVKTIVLDKVKVVADAQTARDTAKLAVDEAQITAGARAKRLTEAQATLDAWRKPGDGISKRLKTAETLLDDTKKLRNGGRRGEAYWKLALGDHASIPGQDFLNQVLNVQPEVIAPDKLRDRIRTAWNEFLEARIAAATASAALAAAQDDLKQKEAELANESKNLIKAITDALAEREAASSAA